MGIFKDQRIQLTIPYPSHLPRGRGIDAVNKIAAQMKVDCQPSELEAINEGARLTGLTRSAFVRWVATHAAKDIINVYSQSDQSVPS